MTAGYSGTPLARKLGIKAGHHVAVVDGPPELEDLLGELPDGAELGAALDDEPDIVLAFHLDAATLTARLDDYAQSVYPDRVIWIAWPKKTSGVTTDLTGDVVRAEVLATTLVDVKVCAISDIWSGLKVVWRVENR